MRVVYWSVIFVFISCNTATGDAVASGDGPANSAEGAAIEPEKPVCPYGHTDSIIPVIYGFPTEESFRKADSGLVALGGCELSDEAWFCRIHQLSF